jgi:hypothetical protein
MAMFHTHIHCSTVAGIVGGAVACVGYGVPLTTSVVGGGLCAIGGILPDIDSGPGIPLREITTFLASVVPTMLITRLLSYNLNQEMLILVGASIYVGIRFGLAHFLRHYTVHRGMFHSFPSMAIFGELTYLLFYGESMFVRVFMVSAVCFGFFIHLLLDEIYSVEWDGRPRIKRSFGTAMKFAGDNWWANATCYAKLIVVTYFVLCDPRVVEQIYAGQGGQVARTLGQSVKDKLDSASSSIRAKTSSSPTGLGSLFSGSSPSQTKGTTSTANQPLINSSMAPAPASNWSSPAAPAAVPSGYSAAAPAADKFYTPVDNRSPAPPRQAPSTRFWQ